MPSLPFDFDDVRNATHPSDILSKKHEDAFSGPQEYLNKKIDDVKKNMNVSGAIDVGLSLNPVTRIVDMGSKFFGGKGIHKEFVDATTKTGDVRVPPLMF